MPAFVTKSRGVVVRLDAKSAELGSVIPFSVRLSGIQSIGNVNGTDSRVLITQVSMSEAGNFQLQHTFGNTIYAYVFGDRVGELKLSGVCFAGSCANQTSGIDAVRATYEAQRIAARQAPVIISFSEKFAVIGLLTGMAMEMTDPENQLMQWSYRFHTFRGER